MSHQRGEIKFKMLQLAYLSKILSAGFQAAWGCVSGKKSEKEITRRCVINANKKSG